MGKIVLTKEGEDWTVSDLRRGLVKKTDGVFEGSVGDTLMHTVR